MISGGSLLVKLPKSSLEELGVHIPDSAGKTCLATADDNGINSV